MSNNDYEFVAMGNPRADETTPYMIKFNRKYTVEEFVKSILTKNEWGYIEINGFEVEYGCHSIALGLGCFYDKEIKSCYASGGWGAMDYKIEVEDNE